MMIKIEGIVLKIQDYREKDALVWILTPEEILTVRARGVQNSTSKLRQVCQPFSYCEWLIDKKENGLSLMIQGQAKQYFYLVNEDLVIQSLCFVISDMLSHTKIKPSIYDLFMMFLTKIQCKDNEVYGYCLYVIKEILIMDGIQPYVNGCIRCHNKKGIETLSFKDGGFLCHECNQGTQKMPKDELLKIYSLFVSDFSQHERLFQLYTFTLNDCLYWADWFEYHTQFRLKSLSFLKKVVEMSL